MEKILEINNVSYSYSQGDDGSISALEQVSFDVYEGEFVVIVGENGSGKSTLAKLLNGLLLPEEGGNVLVQGMNTRNEEDIFNIRSTVGMVFQNPDNQMVATFVEDDIAFGPENLGVPREEIERRIDAVLATVGMEGHRKSTPNKLSGGQKQRIAVASVLAMQPKVLVLDEATSMLDPKGRREVMETLQRLNQIGITIIHITHNMEEAFAASRVLVMNERKLVADTTPSTLFENYHTLADYKLTLPTLLTVRRLLADGGMQLSSTFSEEELVEEICRLL